MELTEEQKAAVAQWFADGMSLDEIQKRIKSEFGIHMTYLDLRLLVAELPQPKEEAGEAGGGEAETTGTSETSGRKPQDSGRNLADEPGSREEDEAWQENGNAEPEACPEGQAAPAPTVTIDALMLPGTIASGDVTFSDGQKGKWFLDQMGRLGLGGDLPQGYRPSPTDAALFQQQLMSLLQAKGLC